MKKHIFDRRLGLYSGKPQTEYWNDLVPYILFQFRVQKQLIHYTAKISFNLHIGLNSSAVLLIFCPWNIISHLCTSQGTEM